MPESTVYQGSNSILNKPNYGSRSGHCLILYDTFNQAPGCPLYNNLTDNHGIGYSYTYWLMQIEYYEF